MEFARRAKHPCEAVSPPLSPLLAAAPRFRGARIPRLKEVIPSACLSILFQLAVFPDKGKLNSELIQAASNEDGCTIRMLGIRGLNTQFPFALEADFLVLS